MRYCVSWDHRPVLGQIGKVNFSYRRSGPKVASGGERYFALEME